MFPDYIQQRNVFCNKPKQMHVQTAILSVSQRLGIHREIQYTSNADGITLRLLCTMFIHYNNAEHPALYLCSRAALLELQSTKTKQYRVTQCLFLTVKLLDVHAIPPC